MDAIMNYDAMSCDEDIDTPSPGTSCSLDGSSSGGCNSLICTEDYSDLLTDDEAILASEADEVCGYQLDAPRLLSLSMELSTSVPEDVTFVVRDDIRKQTEVWAASAPLHPLAEGFFSPSSSSSSSSSFPAPSCRLAPCHRARLVRWMLQVAEAVRLHPTTTFAAVSVMDRYLQSTEMVPTERVLQLLAMASMSVAVKYNEVDQLSQRVWLSLAVDPYGKQIYKPDDLRTMELTLLHTLGWRIHVPTTFTFLQHFLPCLGNPSGGAAAMPQRAAIAYALAAAEISLLSGILLSYAPSTVAMACVALAERLVEPFAATAAASISSRSLAGHPQAASTAAITAVTSACGLPLELLAPRLGPCAEALERCCRAMMSHAGPMQRIRI